MDTVSCNCGKTMTAREAGDLPTHAGIVFCNLSCISAYTAQWRQRQIQLGFDMDGGEPRKESAHAC